MKIGYMYNFETYPPRGGNHVHAMELTQGFISRGHFNGCSVAMYIFYDVKDAMEEGRDVI